MEFDPTSPANQEGMAHVKALLRHIGEDPEREGLLETPKRVLKAMTEHFAGYHEDPASHLEKTFEEVEGYDELVMVSDIELHSHCEHHMVPFVGLAHVAYIPNGRVVGLSKIARVVDSFAKRLQVQEKLTAQIANTIQAALNPQGVAVIIQPLEALYQVRFGLGLTPPVEAILRIAPRPAAFIAGSRCRAVR